MLTAHERLTAHRPVFTFRAVVLCAREADVRLDCGRDPCEALLPLPSPPTNSIETRAPPPHGLHRFSDPMPHTRTLGARLKSHR